MSKYVKLCRPDQWIKNVLVVIGALLCYAILNTQTSLPIFFSSFDFTRLSQMILIFCLGSSSNYILNEYLDRHNDVFHPIKKDRVAVAYQLRPTLVFTIYFLLSVVSILLAVTMSKFTVILVISFLFFGLIYNVKPFRTKDIPFIDVYWESLNAPVRVVAGWHAVQADTFPSISLILGFYFAGVFLMTSKRASELKVLSSNNESSPAKYRRVFEVYTESRLIALLIFNVCLATTFFTIFVTEYNASLLITVPGVFLLFSMNISKVFKDASMVTKTPHYIYRDKATLAVLALFAGLFSLLHSLSAEILQSIIESQFAFLPVIFK